MGSTAIVSLRQNKLAHYPSETVEERFMREVEEKMLDRYPLSLDELKELFSGYTEEEKQQLYQDFLYLEEQLFEGAKKEASFMVVPEVCDCLASKEIADLFQSFGQVHDEKPVYLHLKYRLLNHMRYTYAFDVLQLKRTKLEAVLHWSNACKFFFHVFFNHALRYGYSLVFVNSELLFPHSQALIELCKEAGYEQFTVPPIK